MKILGLTGSIAMGKSTTAKMFAEEGVPVFDADAVVHDLYAKGGKAVERIAALTPDVIKGGAVDRAALSRLVARDASLLPKLEALVHPLVAEAREEFLRAAKEAGHAFALLDIPLLFEGGREDILDAVIVVTAPPHIQRERALSREGMSEEKLDTILARQMPDEEKRKRADFIIDTGSGMEAARARVKDILAGLKEGPDHA